MSAAKPRVAFLGPNGTFTEAALMTLPISANAFLVPASSTPVALEQARTGAADYAFVPIESSVEGAVSITLDELSNGAPLVIVDEAVLPVSFVLMTRKGATLADVRAIAAHPHAHAQTRGWVAANVPGAEIITSTSNGAAAEGLVTSDEYDAAIGPRIAAEIYGLDIVADAIEDTAEAMTRFVLVTKPGVIPAPTGADKTTLALFIRQDHPGALLAILTEFAVRGINLTRIESRPTRRHLGDYYFSVDIEGHVDDARVSEALMGLHRICLDVRYLGSYPRHDGKAPVLRAGVTDADFAEAEDWLRSMKGEN